MDSGVNSIPKLQRFKQYCSISFRSHRWRGIGQGAIAVPSEETLVQWPEEWPLEGWLHL